jgi:hypothetical protein
VRISASEPLFQSLNRLSLLRVARLHLEPEHNNVVGFAIVMEIHTQRRRFLFHLVKEMLRIQQDPRPRPMLLNFVEHPSDILSQLRVSRQRKELLLHDLIEPNQIGHSFPIFAALMRLARRFPDRLHL